MNAEIIKELDKILPVVVRVHGDNHPELCEVGKLYSEFKENPSAALANALKDITANFTVPADACPTFEKTYRDLAELTRDM